MRLPTPARAYRGTQARVSAVAVEAQRRREDRQEQQARVDWPLAIDDGSRLTLVVANHNGLALIGQLVFGLHRVLDRGEVHRLVVVDNASTDGSVALLETLQDAGLVTLVRRHDRPYHGPGLNAGLSFLAARQEDPDFRTDLVGVMDSDVFALRPGGLSAAAGMLRDSGAAMSGPARGEMVPFYAHPSLLLVDPSQVWRGPVPVFREHGAPGIPMQAHLRATGAQILTFPFYKFRYFLHLGHGTVMNLDDHGHRSNRYHPWARTGLQHHYEQDPAGPELHELWSAAFTREVELPTVDALVAACLRPERVDVLGGRDPHAL